MVEKLQGLLGPHVPVQLAGAGMVLTIGAYPFRLLILEEPAAEFAPAGPGPTLAVAAYISREAGRRLRQRGQYYADAMGNAWLELGPAGRTLLAEGARSRRLRLVSDAAFQPHGLRLLTHLLIEPALVSRPEASLARLAGVPLPTVADVLRSLHEAGFLCCAAGPRRLVELPALAARWAAQYGALLRPQLPTQRYQWQPSRHHRPPWVDLARKTRTLLGGHLAARRLLGCPLPSATVTLYAHTPATLGLLRPAGLELHPHGSLEVVRLFLVPAAFPLDYCIHPLLIYADLLRTGCPEDRQVAQQLLRRYLAHLAD